MADRDHRVADLTACCRTNEQYFVNCAYQFLSKRGSMPNRADVEDAISTAYLRAMRRFREDDDLVVGSYRSWFARILFCVCSDQVDSNRKFVTNLEEEFLILSKARKAQAGGGGAEERIALDQAMRSLGKSEQQNIRLKLLGLTAAEIAKLNGGTAQSVRKSVSRGCEKLRGILR